MSSETERMKNSVRATILLRVRKNGLIILAFILVLSALLRFWRLGNVPLGVTHDEVAYIYNSYSIAKTARNVFGEFLPFLTWMTKEGFPFLPVPIYMAVPFSWFLPLSVFTGRLLPALLGVLDVLLVYLFVRQVFGKQSLALVSALFLAISPWHLHFSRSAYDTNYALFFYLLGCVIFLWEIKQKKIPIMSFVSFLLALYSYRGMSIIAIPIMLMLAVYSRVVLRAKPNQLVFFIIGIVFLMGTQWYIIATTGRAYTAEGISIFTNPRMQEEIDTQIREAKGPLLLRRLFLNKPSYIAAKLRENYLRLYSPEFLFLYGEPQQIYSIWSRGRLYFLDLPFLLMGISYLFGINRQGAILLTLFILLGGLPAAFGGPSYSARNFFLSSLFPVVTAAGILWLVNHKSLWKLKPLILSMLVLGYIYSSGSFLFDYFGRYAYYGAEAWAKSLKDISVLIQKDKHNYTTVVATGAFGDFLQYAFHTKLNPRVVQQVWLTGHSIKPEVYRQDNVFFTQQCIEREFERQKNQRISMLFITRADCYRYATPTATIRDYQGNTIWRVYTTAVVGQ